MSKPQKLSNYLAIKLFAYSTFNITEYFKTERILGQGNYGIVYKSITHPGYVFKIFFTDSRYIAENEANMNKIFENVGIGNEIAAAVIVKSPKNMDFFSKLPNNPIIPTEIRNIHNQVITNPEKKKRFNKHVELFKKYKYIAYYRLKEIDITLNDYLKTPLPQDKIRNIAHEIGRILETCKKNKITHGDMHFENIAIDEKGKLTLLDFGFSSKGKSVTFIDVLQLLRSVTVIGDANKNNLRRLRMELGNLAIVKYYFSDFKTITYDEIDEIWDYDRDVNDYYSMF